MSTTPTSEDTLMAKITYPVFFEKLAADSITPQNDADSRELIKLARVVGAAVGTAVNRIVAGESQRASNSIKAATEMVSLVAGKTPAAPAATPAGNFLGDEAVKLAAAAYAAEQLKQAGLGDIAAAVVPTAKTEDEEEEGK